MFLQIDPNNGMAIYEQIVRQVKFAIAQGTLQPGERVLSVRELSRQLAINPNTVARAYQQLQSEQILESVRGLGLQVTASAKRPCQAERTAMIKQRLKSVLQEARHSGLEIAEIKRLVEQQIRTLPTPK